MKKNNLKNLVIVALVAVALTGCNNKPEETEQVSVNLEEVWEHMTLHPVKKEIRTGADYFKLDKLSEGEWLIDGLDGIELSVTEKESGIDGSLYTEARVFVGTECVETFRKPVLVLADDGFTYLYGETLGRSLERIRLVEGGADLLVKESNIIWTDLPEGVTKCCGDLNLHSMGTLGESQEPDGTWRYGVYVEGEEMAAIKSEKQLFFNLDEGIAVNEDGDVYMLYYSSEPWALRAFKVDMPEAVDIHGYWMVEESYIDDGRYGFAYVDAGENIYIIKTKQVEALQRNGMDNLKYHKSLLQEVPTYEVVKAEPKNFDSYATHFGSDALEFFVEGRMDGPDGYIYRLDYHLTEEVEKHYLGLIIPKEELDEVWGGEYDSYAEVQQAIKELNKFLDKWEKENSVKVQNFFLNDPQWVKTYPEVAEKFGITLEDGVAVLNLE